MVLNRKQVEKIKKMPGKKERKVSKVEQERATDQVQENAQNPNVPTNTIPLQQQESVSMESMVTLTSQRLQNQFMTAINLLKCEKYREAVESLKTILTSVEEQPHYGHYAISGRTRNKRTTLSALNMFTALAYEGLANPKKAIEFCNNAISEDPGWPIPFSKRSEYFACLEQFFLETNGAGSEEIIRSRITADVIVDQNYIKGTEEESNNIFSDLQDALNSVSEGDTIFLEEGTYYREEGFNVHHRCIIKGASSKGCILVSKGSPTMQIFGGKGKGGGEIFLQRLQFINNYSKEDLEDEKAESMTSNAAHMYIISPESVTVRDCLFIGGDMKTGGILVAEEAFYQSLLDLEFENPELLGDSTDISEKVLHLTVDFCIFSNCEMNSSVFSNNQATIVISNSWVNNCGKTGLRADEGSTLNIINSQINHCVSSCVQADNVSAVNICGCLIAESAVSKNRANNAGITLNGKSKGNVSKSLLKNHLSAVNVDDSDLVFEENCVVDISDEGDDEAFSEQGLQLQHSAVFVRRSGNVVIQKNNFHNCNLVWLIQHGANPRIVENNVETCLIGFICGARAMPRMERNTFHCILMSIGMFIEDSTGCLSGNVFRYVANGLDIYKGSAPLLARNIYTTLSVTGVQDSLAFDIVKVNNGKVEDMEGSDIITLNANVDEKGVAAAILRRKATAEKLRICSNCAKKKSCVFTCDKCDQISYCSEECRGHDRLRHRVFCSLTLKDMV